MNMKQANPTSNSKSTKSSLRKSQSGLPATTEMALTSDQVMRATVDASRMLPADVMTLQRTMGTRAGGQLIGGNATPPQHQAPLVQPKMTVGPAADAYEIEADKIADQIARSPAPPTPS